MFKGTNQITLTVSKQASTLGHMVVLDTVHVCVVCLLSAACYIVEKHLSQFVEGQDARDVELMWDQMFRATLNYGRKGIVLQVFFWLMAQIVCQIVGEFSPFHHF